MVKFITKTVCMALVVALCMMSLNAQNRTLDNPIKSETAISNVANSISVVRTAPTPPPASRGMVNVTLEAHNIWGDGSGYHLLLDATATQYGVGFPAEANPWTSCPVPATLYNWTTHRCPEDATATCSSHSTFVVDGSVTIQIPAGVYDFCFTNVEAPYNYWFASTDGPFNPRQDNFTFEEGKNYHFLAHLVGGLTDGITLTITDAINECPSVSNVTATAEGSKVTVKWSAATGDVVGYIIYQGTTEVATLPAGTTTWTSGDLINGTYIFKVAAIYDEDCLPVKVAAAPVTVFVCDGVVTNLNVDYNTGCTKATITWDAPTKKRDYPVIYNNGPMITHPGAGPGGTDYSAVNPGEKVLGTAFYQPLDWWMADDFTLTETTDIYGMEFYGIQMDADTDSFFTEIYVEILDGAPNAGGTVIFGDKTTNRIGSSFFSEIYRTSGASNPSMSFPIMTIVADMFVTLEPGTYWIVVSTVGADLDFPLTFANPVTVWGQQANGNALTNSNGPWEPWLDITGTEAQFALPFLIYGEQESPETKYNVYRGDEKIAGPIEERTFVDETFDATKPYTWSVAVVCLPDGDGERVSENMDACGESCNPITDATVEITCELATIIWTAVDGATGYKVNGESVAGTTYTEEGTFEKGKTYTWTIVTVCTSGESEGAEVSGETDCVGINEMSNTVAIFPNPTTGELRVTSYSLQVEKIEIFDVMGRNVQSFEFRVSSSENLNTKHETVLNVSHLPTGVYFFKVYDANNNSITKRVMVTK